MTLGLLANFVSRGSLINLTARPTMTSLHDPSSDMGGSCHGPSTPSTIAPRGC
jgi:hypothetical protein